jgi:hypothetical protein
MLLCRSFRGDSFGTASERICRRCFFLQNLRRRSISPTDVIEVTESQCLLFKIESIFRKQALVLELHFLFLTLPVSVVGHAGLVDLPLHILLMHAMILLFIHIPDISGHPGMDRRLQPAAKWQCRCGA